MSLSFKYPITRADGSEFKSAKELFEHLNGESAGFYLLGTHGFWHGGLHISDATSGYLADARPIRAMATGEVVAYRLNDDYRTSTWGEGADAQTLKYSTSFCLVRHRYESPRMASTAGSTSPGPQNTLVFYSLYMHLLPYSGYAQRVVVQGTSAVAYERCPAIAETPSDSGAMSVPGFASPLYGLHDVPAVNPAIALPSGTELSVLDEVQSTAGDRITKLLYVVVNAVPVSGNPTSQTITAGQHYWIATHGVQLEATTGADIRKRPAYWKSNRKATGTLLHEVSARGEPSAQNVAGAVIHTVPPGTTVKIEQEKLLRQGNKMKPFAQVTILTLGAGSAGPVAVGATVWIRSSGTGLSRDPLIPDRFNVVTCNPPIPVEAGDTIGHLGLYETPGAVDHDKMTRQQAHLEVFTGDPKFNDFFANTAGLTEGRRFKVAGTDGAPAREEVSASGVSTFTPGTDPLLLPVVVDTTPSLAKLDARHKKWFPVEGIGDGGVLTGWVPESRLQNVMQYDWTKLGFRQIEETNATANGYMDPEDVPEFFRKIYRLIDQHPDSDITPDELAAANHNPVVRNALAHVVARHPSEWQGKSDAARWNVLKEKDALLKNDPKRLKHELERIDQLSWWDEIEGVEDFPASSCVWHFNPLTFLDSMAETDDLITLQMLRIVDPGTAESYHREVLPYLNRSARKYGLDKPKRIAHFLSQIAVESHFKNLEEGLSYSVKGMKKKFGCKSPPSGVHAGKFHETPVDIVCNFGQLRSKLWAEADYYAHQPERLANYVYANRMDNGSEETGDGYKYRGRGIIQLTGKRNYTRFKDSHNQKFPEDQRDFVANPDVVLSSLDYGVETAFFYWENVRANSVCDDANSTVLTITNLVNGGLNGYAERKNSFNRIASLLGVPQDN
ncbi:glycoside hydrolase family 19 protein [Paraburkholderia bryophila]|uniref:Putative chitinase n=1 Tax=Paraburkholderia bryophila TaxID=420952 RepID=A0A7Y9WFN0_9BURK|nr:hypothetical protein [Paraburkholderia bryophila]NYH19847.1 putative chitinase [Paraburkholderia bryophila]